VLRIQNFFGAKHRDARHAFRVAILFAGAFLAGCASAPPLTPLPTTQNQTISPSVGDEIALRALAQVGKPYRYGGADLEGFDCSGLVFYVHRELGFEVPRTAAEQYAASHPVNVHKLAPGDLLFFRTTKHRAVTHVAIYAGDGRFVHAPQSGRAIELRQLDDGYYGPRLIGAGRMF
jgi:murein DD-endopeptidase